MCKAPPHWLAVLLINVRLESCLMEAVHLLYNAIAPPL